MIHTWISIYAISVAFVAIISGCSAQPKEFSSSPSPGNASATISESATVSLPIKASTPTPAIPTVNSTSTPSNTLLTLVTTPESGVVTLPPNVDILAFVAIDHDHQILTLYNPSSNTQFRFPYPSGTFPTDLPLDGLSPRGRYLAYFLSDPELVFEDGSNELKLQIWDLWDENIEKEIVLTHRNFPSNLESIVDWLSKDPYFIFEDPTSPETFARIENRYVFASGIQTIAWSPDGGFLALSGQMDSTSLDLYYFDPVISTFTRISAEPEHVNEIYWSPDGSKILYVAYNYFRHGDSGIDRVISRTGEVLLTIPLGEGFFRQWINSEWFLFHGGSDAGGDADLKAINSSTQNEIQLWDDTFATFAIDPQMSLLLVSQDQSRSRSAYPSGGLFLKYLSTGEIFHLSAEREWSVSYWPASSFPFLASNPVEGTIAIRSDGSSIQVDPDHWVPKPSHSGSLIALYRPGDFFYGYTLAGDGLKILSSDFSSIAVEDTLPVACGIFHPNDEGFVFQSGSSLYYLKLDNLALHLLTKDLDGWCQFRWIPGN